MEPHGEEGTEMIGPSLSKWDCYISFFAVLWMLVGTLLAYGEQQAHHKIIFDNQSGQTAVIKLLGVGSSVVKVPKQRKKFVHVVEGEYSIVVRYGDSEKDFTYSKSDPFSVTQLGNQYSIITITLYRTRGGDYNVAPVSREEFENPTRSKAEINSGP